MTTHIIKQLHSLLSKMDVMDADEKTGRLSVGISEKTLPAFLNHSSYSQSLIERQTRTRRLFSYAQLVAFELVYMGTWIVTAG